VTWVRGLIIASLIGLSPGSASAEVMWSNGNQGLDLVLVLDRSASMAGVIENGKHREQDRSEELSTLVLRLLADNAECHRLDQNVAVITFDTRPQVVLPLSSVRNEARVIATISSRIHGALGIPKGRTYYKLALESAAAQLSSPKSRVSRQRAILMITDGSPDPGTRKDISELESLAKRLARERISLWVFLLRPPKGTVSPPIRSLWRRLSRGGVLELSGSRQSVFLLADSWFASHLGTPVIGLNSGRSGLVDATLTLPPYLDFVVFDVFGVSGEVAAQMVPPDSKVPGMERTSNVERRIADGWQTLVVRRPRAGHWRFRTASHRVEAKVLARQFFPRGILVEPRPGERVSQGSTIYLTYGLVDNGRPLLEITGFPLLVKATVSSSLGRIELAPFERIGVTLYRAREQFVCRSSGRYQIEVIVRTRDSDGLSVMVLHDRWSGFVVERKIPVEMTPRFPSAMTKSRRTPSSRFGCVMNADRIFNGPGSSPGGPYGSGVVSPLAGEQRPAAHF
jgi:hypothetical protein